MLIFLPEGFNSFVNNVIGGPDNTSSKTTIMKVARNPKENVTDPDINLTMDSPTVSVRKIILKMHRILMIHEQAALTHMHISPNVEITHAIVSKI